MKLKIAQIVLEESHFRHRPDFLSRPATEAPPPHSVGLRVELNRAPDNSGAVVRLRAEVSDEQAPYLFTVSYLVLFQFEDDGDPIADDLDRRLMITGGTMAFPFARECVANLTARGRFGPTWLAPTDFNKIIASTPPPAMAATGQ